MGLSIVGGLIGGFIASRKCFKQRFTLFDDREFWYECDPDIFDSEDKK